MANTCRDTKEKEVNMYITEAVLQSIDERMGNARRKGNQFALDDQIEFMERLIKNAKKSKLSHIESKATEQAKAIARIEKAMREIDDAIYDLQIIDKRGK